MLSDKLAGGTLRARTRGAFELVYCVVFGLFAWGGLGVAATGLLLGGWILLFGGELWFAGLWVALGVVFATVGTAMAFAAERYDIGEWPDEAEETA